MTDREALHRAVLADPADEAPRLVLADWLDEHDEPDRAEFIRVQCALARLSGGPVPLVCRAVIQPRGLTAVYRATVPILGGPTPEPGQLVTLVPLYSVGPPVRDLEVTAVTVTRRAERPDAEVEVTAVPIDPAAATGRRAGLARREWDLFHRLGFGPIRVGADAYEVGLPADGQPVTVRRGFVEELEVPADEFLAGADELTAAHPLRVLRLESVPAVDRAEGPRPGTVDAALVGRDHWVTVPADLSDEAVVARLFAAEWPALTVHLPTDPEPEEDDWAED